MKVMRSMQLPTREDPVLEQAHGKLIQILEARLLRRGDLARVPGVLGKQLLEVRTLLRECGGRDMEELVVLADEDTRHRRAWVIRVQVVWLAPVDISGEGCIFGLGLDGALREWDETCLGGCGAWCSG